MMTGFERSGLPREDAASYGDFETACVLRISLVAKLGKPILVIYASIFSEESNISSFNNRC